MATPSTMLPRGHSSAPKFPPDIPRELQRYFKELELLFGPAQIVNNAEKKKHTCRYVDIDTADLWEAIPEFDGTKTFDELIRHFETLPQLRIRVEVDHSRYG
jgi:hypothetical protein